MYIQSYVGHTFWWYLYILAACVGCTYVAQELALLKVIFDTSLMHSCSCWFPSSRSGRPSPSTTHICLCTDKSVTNFTHTYWTPGSPVPSARAADPGVAAPWHAASWGRCLPRYRGHLSSYEVWSALLGKVWFVQNWCLAVTCQIGSTQSANNWF